MLVQQRCNLAAGAGDRMQAYSLDVSDLGTAVIATVEDAANPLPPGSKIDAFNCDANGQGYVKVGHASFPSPGVVCPVPVWWSRRSRSPTTHHTTIGDQRLSCCLQS